MILQREDRSVVEDSKISICTGFVQPELAAGEVEKGMIVASAQKRKKGKNTTKDIFCENGLLRKRQRHEYYILFAEYIEMIYFICDNKLQMYHPPQTSASVRPRTDAEPLQWWYIDLSPFSYVNKTAQGTVAECNFCGSSSFASRYSRACCYVGNFCILGNSKASPATKTGLSVEKFSV